MVLDKLPVPGRPTILTTVGQGPVALAVGAGGGGLDIFTLIYPFSSFSLSLGDGPVYTAILSQRAVKPKTTNKPTSNGSLTFIICPAEVENNLPLKPIKFTSAKLRKIFCPSCINNLQTRG